MNLHKTTSIFCTIVLALVLSACATPGGGTNQPQATPSTTTPAAGGERLEGTSWALVSLGKPGEETPVIEGSNVTMEFEDGGQVSGAGGCNSYGGKYNANNGVLTFEDITSTLMACADEQITAQETRYLQALKTAGRYSVDENRLSILYENDQSVLNFEQMAGGSTTSNQSPVITDANLMPTGADEKRYTLTAEAGQTITVEITSDGAPLSLTITSPSGIERFPELTQVNGSYEINHTFTASETGEYRLTLTKADQTPSTNYTATVMVQ